MILNLYDWVASLFCRRLFVGENFEKMVKVTIVYKYEICPLSFKTKIKSLGWKLSELLALEENHPSHHHPRVHVLECSWVALKTLLLGGRRVKERGVKTGISWITPIQNRLNKPCMELEGNQKPRNASIAAQTILRIFFAAEGGGLLETRIWGKMPMQHRSYKPYMGVEGYHTARNT